jgi:hypothetical protein
MFRLVLDVITAAAFVAAAVYLGGRANALIRKMNEIMALPEAYRELSAKTEANTLAIAELTKAVGKLTTAERKRGNL